MRPSGIRKPQLMIAARTRSLALFHHGFGQTDDREARQAVAEIDFDAHQRRFHAVLRAAQYRRDRHPWPPAGSARRVRSYCGFGGRAFWPFSKRCEARFQRFELLARAAQHAGLHVEFLSRDQIELAQPRLQHRLEVVFEVAAQRRDAGGTAAARRRARSSMNVGPWSTPGQNQVRRSASKSPASGASPRLRAGSRNASCSALKQTRGNSAPAQCAAVRRSDSTSFACTNSWHRRCISDAARSGAGNYYDCRRIPRAPMNPEPECNEADYRDHQALQAR